MPWVERYSRVTTLMADFVIKLLKLCMSPMSSRKLLAELKALKPSIGLMTRFTAR